MNQRSLHIAYFRKDKNERINILVNLATPISQATCNKVIPKHTQFFKIYISSESDA